MDVLSNDSMVTVTNEEDPVPAEKHLANDLP